MVLGVASLEFLGHQIDRQGIRPLEEKVNVIRQFPQPTSQRKLHQFPQPTSQRKLRQFLGLVNSYHWFITGCARILQPIHLLLTGSTKSDRTLVWTPTAEAAFKEVKDALSNATLLVHSQSDAPTCIITDASDIAVSAVLQQRIDSVWSPLSYFSRKLTPAETRYSMFDHVPLAVYLAIKHFRHSIEGRRFFIATDNKPLMFALASQSKHHSPRQIRHLDFIAQFTSDIHFLKGSSNAATDALYRVEVDAIHVLSDTVSSIDFAVVARAQRDDPDLTNSADSSSLQLCAIPLPTADTTLLCDMSTGTPRPYVPQPF